MSISDLAHAIQNDARLNQVKTKGYEILKTGLNAGTQYNEVWIRDLQTFVTPALTVMDPNHIRAALINFFHFQLDNGDIPDGYVPVNVGKVNYDYRQVSTLPNLKAHKNTVETDQESSLILSIDRYIKQTGDLPILEEVVNGIKVFERIELALNYVMNNRLSQEHGLIWGGTTADWGDVQPETPWGVNLDENSHRAISIYPNGLFLAALTKYLSMPGLTSENQEKWESVRSRIKNNIRTYLWNTQSQKYIPHIYLDGSPFPSDFNEEEIHFHGGTAVAIGAGLLTKDEIANSLTHMKSNVKLAGAASIGLTIYPVYPDGYFLNPIMTPYAYQNGGDWTWFGGRMISALVDNGFVREAYEELQPMIDRVIKHEGFYEWWTVDNQPKGAAEFRGSAGVLIEAIEQLQTWAQENG